jgi:hypothetical protein
MFIKIHTWWSRNNLYRDREKDTCIDGYSNFGKQTDSYEAIISCTLIENKTMLSIA